MLFRKVITVLLCKFYGTQYTLHVGNAEFINAETCGVHMSSYHWALNG